MDKIYDHFPTKEEIEELSNENEYEKTDPRSSEYERVLTYPKLNIWKIIVNVLIYLIAITIIGIILSYLNIKTGLIIIIQIVLSLIYFIIRLSSILIFIVEIYQLVAPKKIRMKCRFEPSCSDYMIKSIKKYGAFKGLIKGIKRIKRCHYPNGGYDEP